MPHLRNWLNQRGIEPAIFEYYDEGLGNQMYEMSFPDQGQDDLFATAFSKSTFDNKHQPRTTRA